MTPESIKGRRLVGLFLLGFVLFNYPIISLFNIESDLLGIPVLYHYCFGVWLLVIVFIRYVTRNQVRESKPPSDLR
ncbi:MAG: hypothetical protein AMJ54_14355 [Deltaproteobacteria bacterium SG8_13]|nr:MAG: hypothetical protein AMJ54_14355 [Deltaproteobacteria bacterium SG8_13]